MKTFSKTTRLIILSIIILVFTAKASRAQTAPWNSPATAKVVKNPVPADAAAIKDAKTLYVTNCAPCHGDHGKGDGPAAAALNPKPADHTSAAVQSETDGSLFWKISEGHSPMPSYKGTFTPAQRWELVNYIRTLSKVKK